MTWLCPRPCENKTADGYCGTSWCINPMYSNIGTANEKLMGGLRKTTNADRIRAMGDTELALWLAAMLGVNPFDGTGNDYKKWLGWLKQEVSDETLR